MDRRTLQGWWFARQGLMEPQPASAAPVLAATGWARSVGGANPYLSLFARAGVSREEAERALAAGEIHELPSARGCTYVVPAADYALALRVGQGFGEEAAVATARKYLGVTEEELAELSAQVLAALEDRILDPRELRAELGDAVRNLGTEGKKRGTTTTLPLALGRLQAWGKIRRVSVNGRLDGERYRYALWQPSPLEREGPSGPEVYSELARRYFHWTGPASLAHFRWFSGLGVKAAKEAVAPLGLTPLEEGSDLLLFPEDLEALQEFRIPNEPRYALVGSIDGVLHLRRDLDLLLPEESAERAWLERFGLRTQGGLVDLESHGILDRGRLIGLWEYDPAVGQIAWTSYAPRTSELEAAVGRTEAFIRDQLGDARSFSLDSPESRKPRLAALRA